MMTYEPQAQMKKGKHPDLDMEVDIYVHEMGDINIFHTKKFQKDLSWIEYDLNEARIDFIMEDGDLRNFGIPVDASVGPYLQNTHLISVVFRDELTAIEEQFIPLIVHGA